MATRQQTLFRFISLRDPELSKKKGRKKRFVFHPDNITGVFFNAVKDKPADQTKWQAMEDASESFEAFKDVSEIERLDPEFSAVSDWIALNRSTLSVDELSQKTSNLTAFDSATEIKLWDNFFYQVVTQKSFYVKEQLGQFLVLQNLLKEKEENETLKILANAKITLPIVLFNENETKNVTKSTSKVSSDKPVFDSHSLLKSLQKTVAQSSINRNKTAISELKVLQQKFKKEYDRLFTSYQTEYESDVKIAYSNATLVEKERIDCPTGCKEIYYEYEDLVLPDYKFKAPVEIDSKKLKDDLSEQSYYIVESLSLLDSSTYDEIITGIENENLKNANTAYDDQTNNSRLISIGGMVFEKITTGNNPFLTNKQKPYASTVNFISQDPKKGEIIIAIDLGFEGKIVSVSYEATLDTSNTVKSNAFSATTYRTIHNVSLFPDSGVELGRAETLDLKLDIILDDASTVSLTNTISLTGNITGIADLTERAAPIKDVIIAHAPTKFGIRRLGIADYKKVVSEVCCYKAAEVSHIENIMAREFKNKTTTRERIEETTVTTESEREIENLTDTTSTDRFEMQSEIAKLIQQQKETTAYVNVHASYGPITIDTGGTYANNTSKQESNRQAVTQSKELTQRAMERIVSKFRQEVVHKITESYKEENSHIFDNRNGKYHVSGVYRYINAIYKNQIFNYGKRLMYEFMIPQPSKLYRFGMESNGVVTNPTESEMPVKPESPESKEILSSASIQRYNYRFFAATYGASVEAPPSEVLVMGKAYQGNGVNGAHSKEFNDLKVPENYEVREIYYEYSHRRAGNNNLNSHLMIGDRIFEIFKDGSASVGYPTKRTGSLTYYYANDRYNSDTIPVSVTGWDLGGYSINITVRLQLTEEAFQSWQLKTYEAIINAYKERLKEYYDKINENQEETTSFINGNPLFYRQIEQSILKKTCMAYLVQENNLGKGYYMGNNFKDFFIIQNQPMDNYASLVKFMEQAFEWNIMSYSLYPYYWGERTDWKQLFQSEDDDATFRSFMQAGMARVVVTVKPGFEDAVMYFMNTNKIWNGGQVPVIGDELYLSIVDELKEQEYTVEETWETVLPTSLVGIQKSGVAVDEEGLPCGNGCEEEINPMVPNNHKLGVESVNNNP